MRELTEDEKAVITTLRTLADAIELQGFPTKPMFAENDPRDEMRFFLALWRNAGEDRLMTRMKVNPQ